MTLPYEFTTTWFNQHAPVWRSMIADIKPRRVLEIGSFEGRSAVFLIEHCAGLGQFELTCVDSWEGGAEHSDLDMGAVEGRFDRNVAHAQSVHPCLVRKRKSLSLAALARLIADGEGGSFDFIYIDGSHRAADVLADAVLAFDLLRVGGIIAFDDYLWPMDAGMPLLDRPKLGIDAFINVHLDRLRLVPNAPLNQLYAAKLKA